MRRPRENSICFAVHSLRKTLSKSHDKNAYPGGTVKDFVVEKHLDYFVRNGNLKRNFTFWWRHTKPDGSMHYKQVGLQKKKSQRGRRWDEWATVNHRSFSIPFLNFNHSRFPRN